MMLILNSFGILGFRGIGNTFVCGGVFLSQSRADARLGQRFIQVVLQIVLGIQ